MHEGHPIYRVETSARWDLHPSANEELGHAVEQTQQVATQNLDLKRDVATLREQLDALDIKPREPKTASPPPITGREIVKLSDNADIKPRSTPTLKRTRRNGVTSKACHGNAWSGCSSYKTSTSSNARHGFALA
jgi:hypothetical protein